MRLTVWVPGLLVTLACVYGAAGGAQAPAEIRLGSDEAGVAVFEVSGLSPEILSRLRELDPALRDLPGLFSVHVKTGAAAIGDRPPMIGTVRVEGDALRFTPRFPLQPGVSYLAIFDPGSLRQKLGRTDIPDSTTRLVREFAIPRPDALPESVVERVFPSGSRLPENLLKFYLHFSAPMRRGEAYKNIRLLDASGTAVDLPFLELEEELWDHAGKRLTILLDPGRIKRGLRPREEAGPVLEEGKRYTLVVDARWRDARGIPMREPFQKRFTVGPPDDRQPGPSTWMIRPPQAGTRNPLQLDFPEPLDHAMLQRVIQVRDPAGERIEGDISVGHEETVWRLTPHVDWAPGRHTIIVDAALEDLAGNSVERPFEVDVQRPVERRVIRATVSLGFDVAPR